MKKKNLLYIFADQWRAQSVGHRSNGEVMTPNIDAFVEESMEFTNAVSTYPLCSPHRASLLTGKYPYSCGFFSNCKDGLDEVIMLKPQEITITDVLHDAGYVNGYIGKWHLDASDLNFFPKEMTKSKGWDAFTPRGERRHHIDYWFSYGAMNQHLNPFYYDDETRVEYKDTWSVAIETDKAIEFMQSKKGDQPFSLFVSWNPPHPPYDQVPEEYVERYLNQEITFRDNVPDDIKRDPKFQMKVRQYYAAITGIDEYFGKIIKYLKESGLYDDTLIVLSSDHGDCMGSHRLFDKNNWFEESIQIPLYVGGAGIKAGKSEALIASQDHMPTLLNFLGLEIPATVQGISFAPILCGKQQEEPKEAFLCMIPGGVEAVDLFNARGLNHKCYGWRGLRGKEYTYVVINGNHPDERQKRYLYDNVTDPYQEHPVELWSAQSTAFDQALEKYLKLTHDPFIINR